MLLPFPIGTLQCGNPIGCLRTIELSAATVFCGQCQQRSTRDLRTLQGTARSYREQGFAKKKTWTSTLTLHLSICEAFLVTPWKNFHGNRSPSKNPKNWKIKSLKITISPPTTLGFPVSTTFLGEKISFPVKILSRRCGSEDAASLKSQRQTLGEIWDGNPKRPGGLVGGHPVQERSKFWAQSWKEPEFIFQAWRLSGGALASC